MYEEDFGSVVILSTDPTCFRRVDSLCRLVGQYAPRCTTDPMELRQLLQTAPQGFAARHHFGVVLDLSLPQLALKKRTVRETYQLDVRGMRSGQSEMQVAWCVSAVLALAHSPSRVPVLLISSGPYMDGLLDQCGIDVMARVSPVARDDAWLRAFHELNHRIWQNHLAEAPRIGPWHEAHTAPGEDAVKLRPQLWLDLQRHTLLKAEDVVPLTPNEARVSCILAEPLRHFRSANELAYRLTRPGAFPIDEHSIEQTICGLRRKLGETAREPHVLISRRGLGYALCPDPTC